MKDDLYTLAYALGLGSVCALLLTAGGVFTRPYREANMQAETTRNILGVLGIPFPPQASATELIGIADSHIVRSEENGETLYRVKSGGATAFELSGAGVWGPIHGFIALEGDRATIRAIAFHHQEETPGLGGEIASESFRNRFRGKSIRDEHGKPGIRILQTGAARRNEVDGISGATMTCAKVQEIINRTVQRIAVAERNPSDD